MASRQPRFATVQAVNRSDGSGTKDLHVLTFASAFARSIGCARAIHCKSGKDRTSMAVTLEQSTVVVEELLERGFKLTANLSSRPGHTAEPSKDDHTPGKAVRMLMRSHGVRRENMRCNTLADLYAFNREQRALLPKQLRPPMGTFGSKIS